MSVALESGTGIGGSGFIRGIGCGPIYGSLDIQNDVVRPQLLSADSSSSSSSSSSIGKDSCTESEDSEDGAMGEVQSAYKGALQGMGALEESLPIRRSISNFYAGKSKSFTNLSEAMASCASSKDLAKAENAYTRTRRNLLASRIFWERPCKNFLRSPGGGIAKRPGTPARSTLGLAVSMSSSNNSSPRNDDRHCKHLPTTPHAPCKPAVDFAHHLCSFSTRSFSLGDLPVLKCPDSSKEPSDDH